MNRRILVVGAGAVGQVYARHAQLGGAEITFFVREKYVAETRRGFELYQLSFGNTPEPVHFDGFDVVSTIAEVAARTFDQIWITVASNALRGPWLGEILAATRDATVLALQPGQDDLDTILAAGATRERVVSGVITLIAYHAPLPGETRFSKPGTAYWFPPLAPCPVSGERAEQVIAPLRAGGLPIKRHPDVAKLAGFPTAIMMPYLTALESAGWSFDAFAQRIGLGARGAKEALSIVGKPPLVARLLAKPFVIRAGLFVGSLVIPLPLETYLREHFTKVGDQTRMFMRGYIERGRATGQPVEALEELEREL